MYPMKSSARNEAPSDAPAKSVRSLNAFHELESEGII